ncbi:histidine kinase [Microbacterium betulae]|uniref:Histidine kinase n=1 Tax=Microbacterium betulae TaxID=2981139 RepID=A0AA97FJP1_9MICO|nr:histidine kinase [Microbacterium sp. AB]WOF24223.1 histidine kinase [Microbacterium sp. AB]
MPVPPIVRIATVLVALEAVGMLALAGWQAVTLGTAEVTSLPSAIALVVLTVVGAVAVGAFALGIGAGRSWGRSGAIVVQLLVIAIAVGSVTGAYAQWGIGAALGLPAVTVLVVVLLATRDAGRAEAHGNAG